MFMKRPHSIYVPPRFLFKNQYGQYLVTVKDVRSKFKDLKKGDDVIIWVVKDGYITEPQLGYPDYVIAGHDKRAKVSEVLRPVLKNQHMYYDLLMDQLKDVHSEISHDGA